MQDIVLSDNVSEQDIPSYETSEWNPGSDEG